MTGDVGVAVVPGLLCFFFFFLRFTPHPSPDLLCITSKLITAGYVSPWVVAHGRHW